MNYRRYYLRLLRLDSLAMLGELVWQQHVADAPALRDGVFHYVLMAGVACLPNGLLHKRTLRGELPGMALARVGQGWARFAVEAVPGCIPLAVLMVHLGRRHCA